MRAKSNTALGLTYRDGSRLDTLSATVGGVSTSHAYTYQANSNLIATLVQKRGATTFLATTKTYDNLNRLSGISSASSAVSAAYAYNSANQRTKATREDNTYWNYHYDALGQVTSGKKFDAANTALNGLDYAWTFDDIGNRKSATTNSQISNYTSNNLNQYSQRTVPGIIDAFGAADAAATVTVALNGGAPQPTARQGELFFKQFTVDNSAVAQRPSLKITGVKNLVGPGGEDALTEITKTPYLPKTPEVFTYDADGNLTDDARWHYTWDAENRLVAMVPSTVGGALRPDSLRLEFSYDSQGRRISKNVYNWNGAAWVLGTSTRFLHDGWNLLADLNALNSNSVVCTYVWGLDLSGSFQGAGGVGGLLFCNSSLVSSPSTFSLCYDGNGNVIGLVDMATGIKSATYDYNAFGETIQSDGVASVANHFRFSTKYTDDETGLNSYGYRFYDPHSGRFLGRDPIEEAGGMNLYAFVENNPINRRDAFGQASEADDIADAQNTIAEWDAKHWDFAARLLRTFLAGTGTGSFVPSQSDIDKIKNSSEYREAAQSYFEAKAKELCAAGKGGQNIPISDGHGTLSPQSTFAFEPRYYSGELLRALGGAHFYYSGTMTVCCASNCTWSVDVNMAQEDDYTFEPAGFLWYRLWLVPSYATGHELEGTYHYQHFYHVEKWNDKFSNK